MFSSNYTARTRQRDRTGRRLRCLIVSYGGNETAEFKRQTDDFAAAWQTKGFPCRHVDMTAYNNFDLPLQLIDPNSDLTEAVFEQIKTFREDLRRGGPTLLLCTRMMYGCRFN
jgi:hypothetical protein